MVKIEGLSIPDVWKDVSKKLERGKGLAIILGTPDAGKSTLTKFLISNLYEKGIKVGLVDADIGQSFLGPPTTIGLSLLDPEFNSGPPDWEKVKPPSIFFVGSTSPEGQFPVHIEGVKNMVERAQFSGSEVVIVDTTGLVLGEAGRELKRRKIELLSPDYIFALQRTDEIEHILRLYKDDLSIRIHRLPVSEISRSRSREERRIYRNSRFKKYFRDSEVKEIRLKDIKITGKVVGSQAYTIPPERAIRIEGLLIGLKDEKDDTMALGVIDRFEEERLYVYTTLKEIDRVRAIQLGSLKLSPSYEEESF